MTLEQLRIFVAVAELEHVTMAAKSLNVTQSATSAAIAALETRHDVKLFHRTGRRIELSEAGRQFLHEARAVLAQAMTAEQVLTDLGAMKRGTLRLIASQTIAAYWLPERLAHFHARYPNVELSVAIANTDGAAQAVLEGQAELGFVEGAIDDAALAHWPVAQDELLVVGREPIGQGDTPQALQGLVWIMREQGSGTRSTFEAALRTRGLDPASLNVVLTLPSNESVLAAVRTGIGHAALSRLVVAPFVEGGQLAAHPLGLTARPFYALRHKERYASKAADAFLACLKMFDPEQPASGD